jgi:hypothetical protein
LGVGLGLELDNLPLSNCTPPYTAPPTITNPKKINRIIFSHLRDDFDGSEAGAWGGGVSNGSEGIGLGVTSGVEFIIESEFGCVKFSMNLA